MAKLFLSDVHYGAFDDEKNAHIEKDLISLIDYCDQKKIKIHILGDLFDYWMEYPSDKPDIGDNILRRFSFLHNRAGASLYITGNHDYWTNGYFESMGFDVEHDYRLLVTDQHTIFLHHGDGLSHHLLNLRPPFLHRVLKNRFFIKAYQALLPPAKGIALMKWFSGSRKNRKPASPEELNSWSRQFLERFKVDVVISGHDHIPRKETFDFGTYINLGNFYDQRSCVLHTNGNFELVMWKGDTRQLLPLKADKASYKW